LSKDKKLHANTDTRDQLEDESLHEPIHANDFTVLQRSPVAIRNDKTQDIPLSLESLKKTLLELRDSLMLGYKRRNIIPRSNNYY